MLRLATLLAVTVAVGCGGDDPLDDVECTGSWDAAYPGVVGFFSGRCDRACREPTEPAPIDDRCMSSHGFCSPYMIEVDGARDHLAQREEPE